MLKKGQVLNPEGRPKGAKNKPDRSSLREILKDTFNSNHWRIKGALSTFLNDTQDQILSLNELIKVEKDTTNLAHLCRTKSALLSEFKWLMELKASLEPKEVHMDAPQAPQQIVLIRSSQPYNAEELKRESDARSSEHSRIRPEELAR